GKRARARHWGAHLIGPRRAKPRGRPQAPAVSASLRQSLAPVANDRRTQTSWQGVSSALRAPIYHAQITRAQSQNERQHALFEPDRLANDATSAHGAPNRRSKNFATPLDFHPSSNASVSIALTRTLARPRNR